VILNSISRSSVGFWRHTCLVFAAASDCNILSIKSINNVSNYIVTVQLTFLLHNSLAIPLTRWHILQLWSNSRMRRRVHHLPLRLLPPPGVFVGRAHLHSIFSDFHDAGLGGPPSMRRRSLPDIIRCRPSNVAGRRRRGRFCEQRRLWQRKGRETQWDVVVVRSTSPARRAGLQSQYDCAGSQAWAPLV